MLAARKLRRRAQRDASGCYLIEGIVPVREALEARAAVQTVFVASDHPDVEAIAAETAAVGAQLVPATTSVLEAVSDAMTPQGVVAVVEMEDVALGDLIAPGLVLILDELRDPGNAGTLVRCAVAAGASAVVFTKGSVDAYGPKTVRASAGLLHRVDVVRDVELEIAVRDFRERGMAVVGADAAAKTPYDGLDYRGAVAFVVGNEAWGIPQPHRALLTDVVGIPMPGPAESLNAGIAGAIVLFEAVRQRRISSATT